jgi:hypothetical protein
VADEAVEVFFAVDFLAAVFLAGDFFAAAVFVAAGTCASWVTSPTLRRSSSFVDGRCGRPAYDLGNIRA